MHAFASDPLHRITIDPLSENTTGNQPNEQVRYIARCSLTAFSACHSHTTAFSWAHCNVILPLWHYDNGHYHHYGQEVLASVVFVGMLDVRSLTCVGVE